MRGIRENKSKKFMTERKKKSRIDRLRPSLVKMQRYPEASPWDWKRQDQVD